MSEPVAVRVRACACPDTPHGEEGDLVYLLPKPSLACGLEAQGNIGQAMGSGTVLARLWRVTFVRHGAIGWNLTDARGKAVPFDVEALLADFTIASVVAEQADELYGKAITSPLLDRLQAISRIGPIDGSTSPRLQSIPTPRRRSSHATTAASRRRAG